MAFVVGFSSGAVPMVGEGFGGRVGFSSRCGGSAGALAAKKNGGIGRGKVFALVLAVIFWLEYKT